MKQAIIDAHVHLDMYEHEDQQKILHDLNHQCVETLIAVSNHSESAKRNLELARRDTRVKPALGYHPEQPLPTDGEVEELVRMLHDEQESVVAVGEVGLPYYLRKEHPWIHVESYLSLLEVFVKEAALLQKPIILHAIYDDADPVCDLLEKYSIKKAHFHWFKGEGKTVERMIRNGYSISFTPDCVYEEEIQGLIEQYPLDLMMVETDGPWPFEGPFQGNITYPWMIHESVKKIAEVKHIQLNQAYTALLENTKQFYSMNNEERTRP